MRKSLLVLALIAVCSSASFAFELKMPSFGKSSAADDKQKKAQDILDDARRAYGSAAYPKTIELATQAIQISPKFSNAYLLRAKASKDMGDVDSCLKDINTAIQLDPKSAEAYFIRGSASEIMGDMKSAKADFDKACSGGFKDACK